MNNDPTLSLRGLRKSYRQGSETLEILKDINLELKPGEIVGLVGASGSGKSTLLHLTGLLEKASAGQILIQDQDIGPFNEEKRAQVRRHKIGFVYQFHHLLPEFTALENVMMPLVIQGSPLEKASLKAYEYLHLLNLQNRAEHRPSKLSGGEQQRVAILRALITEPKLLLADEPTGNLDTQTSESVFKELLSLVRTHKAAALIATHDLTLAKKMDRVVSLKAGILQGAA